MRRILASLFCFLSVVHAAAGGEALHAKELIGSRTVDVHGEPLGRVEDLLLAKEGATHYAVLSFRSALGLGERLYTYPLSELAPGRRDGEIVVEVERTELVEQAGRKLLPLVLRLYDPNALLADPPFVRASELPGGERYLVPRG